MNTEVDQIDIVKKSKIAMIALSTRTVLLSLIQVVSRIVLAKNLMAADFGSFGIIQGWIGTLMFFTDIGLGDVLSRRSQGISEEDFSSYFYLRLLFSIIIALLFILFYPLLRVHYGLDFPYAGFAGFVAIFIVMDVISACPMMLMGHKMEFVKIAQIELGGLLLTYVIQIIFSYFIKGPWPFFVGLFWGKLLTIYMSFKLAGKVPLPKKNFQLLKSNFKKGVLFQISTILPSLQAIISPFIMSYFLKVDNIGLIFWIEGLVGIPLGIINNYNRVAFISLSKFAHDEERLREVVSSFLNPMFVGICFVFGLGAVLSKHIILLIFGTKWIEATYYVHLSCIAIGLYSLRFLGLSVLSATDKPQVRVFNEVLLIVLTAIMLVVFIYFYNINGYFFGSIASYVVCLAAMMYSLRLHIYPSVYRRLIASLTGMILSIVLIFNLKFIDQKIYLAGIFYVVFFLIISILIDSSVIEDTKKVLKKFSNKVLIKI